MSEHPSDMDFSEVIHLFNNITSRQKMSDPHRLSDIDKAIHNQQMRIMKVALPYFDFKFQKNMAIMLKMLEFKKTIEIYNSTEEEFFQKIPRKDVDRLNVLNEIRDHCDEPSQKKINDIIMLLNFQKSMESYKSFKNTAPEPSPEDMNYKGDPTGKENYNQFMEMVNRIINEKEGG